jgi:2-iminobutanoate/2-iminopropanoate deaminase
VGYFESLSFRFACHPGESRPCDERSDYQLTYEHQSKVSHNAAQPQPDWNIDPVLLCRNVRLPQAVDFKQGMPFSDAYIAGNTLYLAGQQGPDANGKIAGLDISKQTENTIAAIERIVKRAGFRMADIKSVTVYIADLNDVPKMNEVYKRLMPNPKPARATVQVAGLIGGAKIEISAIAVKQ